MHQVLPAWHGGPVDYWDRRVDRYGRRSVLNVAHGDDEFDEVTAMQKAECFPYLRQMLRGDEEVVVDLGCGPGRFTGDLADIISGQAIGLDITDKLLRLAPAHSKVDYRRMQEGEIPLDDASVDVVWVCLVLGGMRGETLQSTAAEIDRVLRDDGLLFLIENTSTTPDSEHWAYRGTSTYIAMFPGFELQHLHDYVDLDETMSVIAGRKRSRSRGS